VLYKKRGERREVMGKAAKGSRKGKKAWRANISTADIDAYFEKATRDSLSGAAALPHLPDDALFLFASDDDQTNKTKKRKTEIQREKPLRHEALLQRNPFVTTLPSSKRHPAQPQPQPKRHEAPDHNSDSDPDSLYLHIWDDSTAAPSAHPRKPSTTTSIPAVEIEPLGCSFNPPFEAHQDALAQAVADEMQKLYKKELQPDPIPRTVPGELIPEEEVRIRRTLRPTLT
jgi:nucleolar protein 53